jgi:hypothetical protein
MRGTRLLEHAPRVGGGGARNGRGPTSTADAAIVDALDRLLDPIENLLQEEFPSERPTTTGDVSPRRPWPHIPLGPIGPRSLSGFVLRVLYSRRSPYQQARQVVSWCLYGLTVMTVAWLVVEWRL